MPDNDMNVNTPNSANRNEEKAGCGCCSILLLDFVALTVGTAMIIHNATELHWLISFALGLAIIIAFIFIARLPYVGRIFQAALGLAWGAIIYYTLDGVFKYSQIEGMMTAMRTNDPLTWWFLVIIINLFFIVIHIWGFNKSLPTLNFRRKFKHKNQNMSDFEDRAVNLEDFTSNEYKWYNPDTDEWVSYEEYCEYLHHEPFDDTQSSTKESQEKIPVMFFQGCDTLEKLEKRYKNLAKTFHPDTEAGDTETMKAINAEYDRLKKEFENDS